MRTLILIGAVVALGGCAETYSGPRLVHYNPDWFYIRHAPLIDSGSRIDQLAAQQCPAPDRPAQLVDVAQDNPVDLRDATYRCQRQTPVASAVMEPALTAPSAGG